MHRTLSSMVCAGVLLSCCAPPALAAAIVFSNEADFKAATAATLHELPTTTAGTYTIVTTDGLLTLTTGGISGTTTLHSNTEVTTGVSRLDGPDLGIGGVESFDGSVTLGGDRYAFGFGIYEPTVADLTGCNTAPIAPCVDSTFTITLFHNNAQVGSAFTLSPANDTAVFWGVHTSFAFDAFKVRETIGSNDNEFFGTFYTGSTPIPEPGTLVLLGGGAALAGLRRRLRA